MDMLPTKIEVVPIMAPSFAWAAPPRVWGDDIPFTFVACTPQGVQQNSNSTSHSDISRLACSRNALFQTFFPQKSMELEVVIITPEFML